jgi:hypothetical protein
LRREHAAQGLEQRAPAGLGGKLRVFLQHLFVPVRKQRHRIQLFQCDQARAHTVVDVVRVVGQFVGQVHHLRFQAGLRAVQETLGRSAGLGSRQALGVAARTVLENAAACLPGEVQAVEARVARFELVHHAQALQVVLKAAVFAHALVQGVLAGMAEGCVPQVVGQRDGLDQVFIQTQCARR